ncbi:neuropilin and tolloid-like protein 2 [Sinocyclocheilus rhinocerous]|uniref:neuropilin and tolloid-like protein 2 n=1 Tax=Sinocyclocheilus rhinocerous TaxID=307959 RepID=UPI0007BA28B3|nr:PREDICTED: neuropilin and tolloid-like protein 2 [Sinocyclocheilus rhinocerous]
MHEALVLLILIEEGFALAQKTQALPQNVAVEDKKPAHCGTLIQTANGGSFSSPNYPNTYPPNKECVYILEAHPRKRIQLVFDDIYYIEPSFECRFDNIEIRDGPFVFSPLINRYCGAKSPGIVTSSGRFMWIRFISDEELEGLGFRVEYSYTADPDFHLHIGGLLNPIPDCQFEMSGSDGIIRSSQVEEENKVKSGEALDCIWTIRAPPMSKVSNAALMKHPFLSHRFEQSLTSSLRMKLCKIHDNIYTDMLLQGFDLNELMFTKLEKYSFFLLCCLLSLLSLSLTEKKSKSFFQQMSKTHSTVIGVASGVVLLLLIISVFIQMKQPRKKVLSRKGLLSAAEMQEVLEPPQYELFSMQEAELPEDLSEELESLQKLRRSSSVSRCVHEHHCGAPSSAASIVMASRVHRLSQASDEMSTVVGARGWGSFHGRRSSSHFTHDPRAHAYSAQSLREALDDEELGLEGRVMEEIGYNDFITRGCNAMMVRNHANPVQQRSLSMDF